MTILLKYWKNILIVVLALFVFGSVRQCSENASDKVVLLNAMDSAFVVAHYYKTKHGEVIGQVKTHELTIEQYKKYGNQLGFENKKLKEQVGKANRLVAHWMGKVSSTDSIYIVLRDTSLNTMDESMGLNEPETAKVFEWSSKHLSLEGIIHLDSNQLALSYKYSSDFSLTAYRKSNGLFKGSQLVADIWFDDPNMRVREFKGFVIQEPKKRFYQTGLFKLSIGIGIGYVLAKSL